MVLLGFFVMVEFHHRTPRKGKIDRLSGQIVVVVEVGNKVPSVTEDSNWAIEGFGRSDGESSCYN